MTNIRAVIFDLDGVIIDSMPVIRAAFTYAYHQIVNPAAQEPEIDKFFHEYCKYLGHGFTQIMEELGLPHTMKAPFVQYSRESIDNVTLYAGVTELLAALRNRGIKLTISTGKDGYRARELLARKNIQGYFDIITGSDEAPRPKPAPDMLLQQLRALGIPTSAAIMVGDSPADIQAGRAAKIITLGALWGYGSRAALQDADYLCTHIDEIFKFIQDEHPTRSIHQSPENLPSASE